MNTDKEKAINLILQGLVIQFTPLLTVQVFREYINTLFPSLLLLTTWLVFLFCFLKGYYPLIKGCSLYIASKGYSYKWGFIGLLSVFGLSILLLAPYKSNILNSQTFQSEIEANEPFKTINVPELFMHWYIVIPFLLFPILNVFNLSKTSNAIIIYIVTAIYFAYTLFKECQNTGLNFNQIVGKKKYINLKLIVLVLLSYAFNKGFYSLLLYNLSFIFPKYVEDYLNKKFFTNIPEMVACFIFSIILIPLITEFFFRGIILQKWAIKWGVKTGVLTSSLLFAFIQFRFDIISSFITGIILSILYFKTHSLITPILFSFLDRIIFAFFGIKEYLSESPIERNAFISAKDYQVLIEPLLSQRIFLITVSVPFLIYFVYKYFPRNDAIIPYYANAAKIPETN